MTDETDIMERLRSTSPRHNQLTGDHVFDVFNNRDGQEAADLILTLRAQLAEAIKFRDRYETEADAHAQTALDALSDLAERTAALRKYGRHTRQCDRDWRENGYPCSCGFTAALAKGASDADRI